MLGGVLSDRDLIRPLRRMIGRSEFLKPETALNLRGFDLRGFFQVEQQICKHDLAAFWHDANLPHRLQLRQIACTTASAVFPLSI